MTPQVTKDMQKAGKWNTKGNFKVDADQVAEMYVNNMTTDEIAAVMKVSVTTVHAALVRKGVPRRPFGPRNPARGQNHPGWKGKDVSYKGGHVRVNTTRGKPKKCSVCGSEDPSRHYDWADMNGDMSDPRPFVRMCRSCHWKHDKKALNFTKGRKNCDQK